MDESTQLLKALTRPYADMLGVPPYVLNIGVLLLIGVVGHFFIRWSLARIRSAATRTQTPWDDVFAQALSRPGEWAMWILILYTSLGVLGRFADLRESLAQAADTGVILLLGWFLHRLVLGGESELLGSHRGTRDSGDRAAISSSARLLRISLWIAVALMVLQSIGVSISGLLAFGGIGGIAIGFAARDVLANFLGGLTIYLDRPFTVGDWIRSPDRQIEGTVEHIGWRMTRIRTFDQRPLYVPNAIFSNVALENPSRMLNRRIYETFGIRYADAAQMQAIVNEVKTLLESHPELDLSRTLIVNFVSCGPSSLDFFVYTFTKTTNWVEYHRIKQDVLLRILSIIEAAGAEVAFPSQTLYLADDETPPAIQVEPLPES